MKEQILNLLMPIIHNDNLIRAAWLGGSKATGREDDLSDIDLVIVGNQPDEIFNHLEECIAKELTIDQTWISETKTPYYQRFYTLKDTAPTFYLDVVIFNHHKLHESFNQERHGNPFILSDKDHLLEECAKNSKREQLNFSKDNEIAKFEILYRTFLKEAKRNNLIDSYNFYHRLLTTFIRLKRLKYTPQRHDFGLRYIYSDLPLKEHSFIESLIKISDIEGMKKNAELMKAEFVSTANESFSI